MSLLTKRTVLFAVAETTEGTPVAAGATDAILAEDIAVKPIVEKLSRNASKASLGQLALVTGMRHVEVSFKTEVKNGGTAGTSYAPLTALLQSCGMVATVNAGVSVVYAPSSAKVANFQGPGKSCTIEWYADGLKQILAGARGSWKATLEAGKVAYYEFTLKGIYGTVADAAIAATTFSAIEPARVLSATATIQAYAATLAKLEIDINNDVQMRPDVNAATSVGGFIIVGRDPQGSVDPEAVLVAAHDFYGKLISGVQASSGAVVGATAGNITTFAMPKTSYKELTPGDRNGIRTFDLGLQFAENSGDDEITITLT